MNGTTTGQAGCPAISSSDETAAGALAAYAATPCPQPATSDQVEAWEGIKRTILGSSDPRALAGRALELFGEETIRHECAELGGRCIGAYCAPSQASGEPVHQAVEHNLDTPDGTGTYLGFHLSHFPEDKPRIVFEGAGGWSPLDLAAADQVLADLGEHLFRLRQVRNQLAALLGAAPSNGYGCGQRRPGYDLDTGRPLAGHTEADTTLSTPCTAADGHSGDHRDGLGRTWSRQADEVTR
jgi:hypothetical protein